MPLNDIGDFGVWDDDLEDARERQAERSKESRAQDRNKRAPVTTRYESWADNPDELDFPGIDTPSENPDVLPKDLKDPAYTRTTAKARDESPTEPVQRTERDYQMERLGSSDLTLTPGEAFEGQYAEGRGASGQRPSSATLSEDAYQNLAGGKQADEYFIESERDRARGSRGENISTAADRAQLAESDVSLSPDEAFRGVAATSRQSGDVFDALGYDTDEDVGLDFKGPKVDVRPE